MRVCDDLLREVNHNLALLFLPLNRRKTRKNERFLCSDVAPDGAIMVYRYHADETLRVYRENVRPRQRPIIGHLNERVKFAFSEW